MLGDKISAIYVELNGWAGNRNSLWAFGSLLLAKGAHSISTQDTNPQRDNRKIDFSFVQELAAANGLTISPKRAAELVPAVQAIMDAHFNS